MYDLKEKIIELINLKKEGDYWDFKEKWQEETSDLIKDIICFANTPHNKDCYIIYGVTNNFEIIGLNRDNRRKQADIINTLSSLNFANKEIPQIELQSFEIHNKILDILIIKDSDKTPFYLEKSYGEMFANCIYTRNGDTNTPNKSNAKYNEIELLWKKRFGLSNSIKDNYKKHLLNIDEWESSEEPNGNYSYYNKYNPKLKIVFESEKEREYKEDSEHKFEFKSQFYKPYFAYLIDEEEYYVDYISLYVGDTKIDEFIKFVLDGGRISIVEPQYRYQKSHEEDIFYCYYIKDNLQYALHKFCYDKSSTDKEYSYRNIKNSILFFTSKNEKEEFEKYISQNLGKIKKEISQVKKIYSYYYKKDTPSIIEHHDRCIKTGLVLNKELKNFKNL